MARLIETAAQNIAGWAIEIIESADRCAVTLRDSERDYREVIAVFEAHEVNAARAAASIAARTLAVSSLVGRAGHA